MLNIKCKNKLTESEDGRQVFYNNKWYSIVVFADLTNDDSFEFDYEYWLTA